MFLVKETKIRVNQLIYWKIVWNWKKNTSLFGTGHWPFQSPIAMVSPSHPPGNSIHRYERIHLVWSSGQSQFKRKLSQVTDVYTCNLSKKNILQVKWKLFVSRWCIKSALLKLSLTLTLTLTWDILRLCLKLALKTSYCNIDNP